MIRIIESLVEDEAFNVVEDSEWTSESAELFNEIVTVGKNANSVAEVPEDEAEETEELSVKPVDDGVDNEAGGNGHQ